MSTFFSQLPASGQQGPAPAPGQPVQGPPPDAPVGGAPPMSGMTTLLFMLMPVLLIVFTMRNQSKKQKAAEQSLQSLKTGDTVVTQAGLIGKIIEMNERTVRLEIAPGVNVRLLKTAIQGIDPGDTKVDPKADPKDSKESKDAKSIEKKA